MRRNRTCLFDIGRSTSLVRVAALVFVCLAALGPACGGDDSPSGGAAGTDGGVAGSSGAGTDAGGSGGNTGCTGPAACDDGFSCTIDSCSSGQCQHTIGSTAGATACPPGQYCTLETGCIPPPACKTASDCAEAWQGDACKDDVRCDPASSVCLFSVLDKDADEHPPQICGGDDCDDSDADRYPGRPEDCDGKDNDCDGEVDENTTCGGLLQCENGSCRCPADHACGSECVDKSVDSAHCGQCDHACVAGASCTSGSCDCPGSTVECQEKCADLETDEENCGVCGTACAVGGVCESSTCRCPQGQVECTGVCVDTSTSPSHCGDCATACATGLSCVAGTCQCTGGWHDPTCSGGQDASCEQLQSGAISDGTRARLHGVVVTTREFLVSKSNANGACLWGTFVRDPVANYGLMVIAYGDQAPSSGSGGFGDCPTGTDPIPDCIAPGDIVDVAGDKDSFVSSACTNGAAPQVMLKVCEFSKTGAGPASAPVVVANPAALKTGGKDYQGLLVRIENVDAENNDGGTVGPYGIITLAGSGLEIHDDLYWKSMGTPQFGPGQHFASVVGVNYLHYCDWVLEPRDKCVDFDPKSTDCP